MIFSQTFLLTLSPSIHRLLLWSRYDFILRFGGPWTGTLTGLCDFFGGVFCTIIYSTYSGLLARGGWPLVFRAYAAMQVMAAVAIGSFCVMEARDPLKRSPLAAG